MGKFERATRDLDFSFLKKLRASEPQEIDIDDINLQPALVKKSSRPEILTRTIKAALRNLEVSGCAYKVIADDGELFAHKLERFEPIKPTKKFTKTFRNGELKDYYMPFLQNLTVGGVVSIPAQGAMNIKVLQHAITAQLSTMWGNGSYTTYMNRKDNTLEVLRKE